MDATFSHHGVWFGLQNAELDSAIQVVGEEGEVTSQSSRPAAILLSHGKNGLGGVQFIQAGRVAAMPVAVSADERENTDADVRYVDKPYMQGEAVFDDQLVMLSPKVLIARMVEAQRLP